MDFGDFLNKKWAEKDTYEEIEEEVERNVREEPKHGPRRRDKERRTVEVDDEDTDKDKDTEEDEDLSMNYKDIGGSISEDLLREAVHRAKEGQEDDPEDGPLLSPDDKDDEDGGEENDDGGEGDDDENEDLEDKDLEDLKGDEYAVDDDEVEEMMDEVEDGGDESEDDPEDESNEETGNPFREDGSGEDASDGESGDQADGEDMKTDFLRSFRESQISEDLEKYKDRSLDDEQKRSLAIEWSDKNPATLKDIIQSDDLPSHLKNVADQAMKMKVSPVPPSWSQEKVFESGHLTLPARKRFRDHMEDWDLKTFIDNLSAIKKKQIAVSLMSGSEKQERYFSVLLDLVKESKEQLVEDVEPMSSLEDALREDDDLEGDFEARDRDRLKKRMKQWRTRLRRTRLEVVEEILGEVRERIDQVEDSLSKKYTWLVTLEDVLEGAKAMKEKSREVSFGEDDDVVEMSEKVKESIKKGFEKGASKDGFDKEAVYRGLPGPTRDDSFSPPKPKWEKKMILDMDVRDYVKILRGAIEWLRRPEKSRRLREYNPEHALRIALDHAIWGVDGGSYDHAIDTPTYNDLLDALRQIVEGSDD